LQAVRAVAPVGTQEGACEVLAVPFLQHGVEAIAILPDVLDSRDPLDAARTQQAPQHPGSGIAIELQPAPELLLAHRAGAMLQRQHFLVIGRQRRVLGCRAAPALAPDALGALGEGLAGGRLGRGTHVFSHWTPPASWVVGWSGRAMPSPSVFCAVCGRDN